MYSLHCVYTHICTQPIHTHIQLNEYVHIYIHTYVYIYFDKEGQVVQYNCVCAQSVAQSCPPMSNPMDCSLPGSSVRGFFQARILE